jgi:uncharacterized protein YkwD
MEYFSLNGNYIDFIILIILLYFINEAFRIGFWICFSDFISFLLSLLISLKAYGYIAFFLKTNFSLPSSISNAIGFLLTASVSQFILGYLIFSLIKKIPNRFWKKNIINKILAVFPSVGEAIVIVSFILTLALSFPISPKVKTDISDSRIGGFLVQKTSGMEIKLKEVFGSLIDDTLTYLIVEPGSENKVNLNVGSVNLTVDEVSEKEIFGLLNQERLKFRIGQLSLDSKLIEVARGHANDMWERKYFSHYSPEGVNVGTRLEKAGISFNLAGENLALAPTVKTAHFGLMNSPGHRENILDSGYKRVGVGVIDNGIYGKMFVQVFTN